MRLLSFVRAPHCARRALAVPAALSIALGLAGCAGEQSTYREGSWLGGGVVPPPPAVAMEGDGLPVQIPPLRRETPEKDDPAEPFSRNYGPSPEQSETPVPVQQPLRREIPAKVRTRLAVAIEE